MAEDKPDVVPRELRTPTNTAAVVIEHLINWQMHIFETTLGKSAKDAEESVFGLFKILWDDDDTDGDELKEELFSLTEEEFKKDPGYVPALTMVISLAYCTQAMKAAKQGEVNLAWTYAGDAEYWVGILWGVVSGGTSLSGNARRAAGIRHQPNREKIAQIKAWYKDEGDNYPSKDKAAEDATDRFNLAFRTIRKHITGL